MSPEQKKLRKIILKEYIRCSYNLAFEHLKINKHLPVDQINKIIQYNDYYLMVSIPGLKNLQFSINYNTYNICFLFTEMIKQKIKYGIEIRFYDFSLDDAFGDYFDFNSFCYNFNTLILKDHDTLIHIINKTQVTYLNGSVITDEGKVETYIPGLFLFKEYIELYS